MTRIPTTTSRPVAPEPINHPLADGVPPAWASGWGEDAYGIFADLELPPHLLPTAADDDNANATPAPTTRPHPRPVRQRMRWIPPGRFRMGSPEHEPGRYEDEGPDHFVTISEPGFWLGETPCTQELWMAVMDGANPAQFKDEQQGKAPARLRPVESVSWDDCAAFMQRLDAVTESPGWRLPWECEWEYACRAGTETMTYGGSWKSDKEAARVLDPIAWWSGNSEGRTHAVGQKAANAWGLFDMLGNVWEWCGDGMREYTAEAPEPAPRGPTESGDHRVVRGGSWILGLPRRLRAALRFALHPADRGDGIGFRLARGPAGAGSGWTSQTGGAGGQAGGAGIRGERSEEDITLHGVQGRTEVSESGRDQLHAENSPDAARREVDGDDAMHPSAADAPPDVLREAESIAKQLSTPISDDGRFGSLLESLTSIYDAHHENPDVRKHVARGLHEASLNAARDVAWTDIILDQLRPMHARYPDDRHIRVVLADALSYAVARAGGDTIEADRLLDELRAVYISGPSEGDVLDALVYALRDAARNTDEASYRLDKFLDELRLLHARSPSNPRVVEALKLVLLRASSRGGTDPTRRAALFDELKTLE